MGDLATVMNARSLLAKHALCQLAAGGSPALHFSYWMGTALQGHFPFPPDATVLTGQPPVQFVVLQDLLLNVMVPTVSLLFFWPSSHGPAEC
jgi:hypothetical protein